MKSETYKEWYYQAKKYHICPSCAGKVAEGKVYCPTCLDNQAVCQMKKRAKMTPEERQAMSRKNADRLKMKYHEAREKGLCVTCHKNAPVPGKYSCRSSGEISCFSLSTLFTRFSNPEYICSHISFIIYVYSPFLFLLSLLS